MDSLIPCHICSHPNSEMSTAKTLEFVHQDGTKMNPLEILAKIAEEDEIDLSLKDVIFICGPCVNDLQNLTIMQHNFSKLRCSVSSKIKQIANFSQDVKKKRKVKKPSKLTNSESDSEDNQESGRTLLHEVPLGDNAVLNSDVAKLNFIKTYIQINLLTGYSKCTLSKLLDYKIRCLSRHCSLEISFEYAFERNLLIVTTRGTVSSHTNDDANRVLFELTKSEFQEESICEFCCDRFDNEDLLNQHLNSLQECMYKCPLCSLESRTFQARNSHFLLKHTTDRPYKCSNKNCKLAFKTRNKKASHERSCVFHVRFSCPQCQKSFVSKRNLSDHIMISHEKDENQLKFQCPHCSKRFFKKCNYDSHLISHINDENKRFRCDLCDQTFKRIRSLNTHRELKHGEVKKAFLCSDCGRCLESYTGYKQHLAKHGASEYIKRNYTCLHCEKSFRSPADLKMHEVVHTKSKNFTCDICKATFTQKSSLKDHYNVHTKRFTCPVCSKSFGRQRYLDNHVRSCGQSRKEAEQSATTEEVIATETINKHEAGTVIVIDEAGQQQTLQQVSFMVTSNPSVQED